MTSNLPRNTEKNLAIWNSLYGSYQKGTIMPGTQYPNLRLVDFIRRWKASPAWPKNRRPRVLELGFGSIANMRMMAEEGCDVHGLEVSDDCVQPALKAIELFGLQDHLSAALFNGVTISEPDHSFDAIVGLQCVYNNLHQMEFADDCARLLKPGGLLFISFFTTRHGYMKHINGQPGGPVTFTDDHPNPRLPGLEVFLYRDVDQFQEVYGRDFNIEVNSYETDLLEVYQSWNYLRGQKKDRPSDCVFCVPGSSPGNLLPGPFMPTENDKKNMGHNINKIREHEPLKNGTEKTLLQDHPNVEIVRFLATWSRRQKKDYFRHIIGREMESTEVQGLKGLEINAVGPSHLLAMDRFKYIAHGTCLANEMTKSISGFLNKVDVEQRPLVKTWDGSELPFENSQFDVLFSLSSNLVCDQSGLAKEIARTSGPDGEIFMAYVSPRSGVLEKAEHIGRNFYKLCEDFDELNRKDMILFVATDEGLRDIWAPYFNVTVNHFEYAGFPTLLSYQVVTGKRNDRPD